MAFAALWKRLSGLRSLGSMIGCSHRMAYRVEYGLKKSTVDGIERDILTFAPGSKDSGVEAEIANSGIFQRHAFAMIDLKELVLSDSSVKLVRVRNPWGTSSEWKLRWSDGSEEVKRHKNALIKAFRECVATDGEKKFTEAEPFVDNPSVSLNALTAREEVCGAMSVI